MLRKLLSKLSISFSQSVVSTRQSFSAPVRIWFEPVRVTGRLEMPGKVHSVHGETRNISESGIAFLVSSIRVEENYLVGDGRLLNAEIDLPAGRVRMQVIGRRYEQLESAGMPGRYLIGASIEDMPDSHRQVYENFVRNGVRRSKRGASVAVEEI